MRAPLATAVLAGAVLSGSSLTTAGGNPPLPDLVIGRETLRRTLAVSSVQVSPGDCTVVEGCVRGLGARRTLVFDTEIINQGDADVVLGDPHDHPELFEFSPCHGHYHLKDSIHYALSHGGSDTVSLYDDAQGLFHIRSGNAAGGPEDVFALGPAGRGLVPIAGDWNGDGTSTAGLYDPATGRFRLTNAVHPARAEIQFIFRPAKGPFLPIAGDWDGGGKDSVGLFEPSTGTFYLRSARPGGSLIGLPLGRPFPGWLPLAGDWYGDDVDGVGLYNPASGGFLLLARSRKVRPPRFTFGPPGMRPIVGDWDRDGVDTIGIYDLATGVVLLRNANSDGAPDVAFTLAGGGASAPVVGDWDYEDGVPLPAVGYKQAFCWVDHHRVSGNKPLRFDSCNTNQGISVGWADVYVRGLDCQWIDIEGLPGGNYQLRVAVNEGQLIPESDYTNNATRIKVHIPGIGALSPRVGPAP
jgi:hypothetical protein